MNRQLELISQITAYTLQINSTPGRTASAQIGGRFNEISIVVLEDQHIEPLISRTAELATLADSELTIRRVCRTLEGLVDTLSSIAQPQPRGAA